MQAPRVCLSMIVKNEELVLRRCLESVRPFISSYLICDTGSTDGTIGIARKTLKGLPGEVLERPWVNFAVNRNEALESAIKRSDADYLLILDADEVLRIEPGFSLPPVLEKSAYYFPVESGGVLYDKIQLVDARLPWEYRGVLHEYIVCPAPPPGYAEERLIGVTCVRYADGARARDPLTYRKDALLLENALLEEPNNLRYLFYLAQSYRDAGDLENAVKFYRRRFVMGGGYAEETWYAGYQVAALRHRNAGIGSWPETLQAYLEAFAARPSRAEPLYAAAMHYSRTRQYSLAYLFLRTALEIPYPEKDMLFVEKEVYLYLLPLETAVAAYWTGRDEEALDIYDSLFLEPDLPPETRALAERNRQFSLDRNAGDR
jgi:glycosyltransferase involved in cell wall biosynthesis